jgi:hypothetical protein
VTDGFFYPGRATFAKEVDVNKTALIGPVLFLLAGLYVIAMSLGGGEEVALIPGHPVPTRFGYLLGGLGVVGGLVFAALFMGCLRKKATPRSVGSAE